MHSFKWCQGVVIELEQSYLKTRASETSLFPNDIVILLVLILVVCADFFCCTRSHLKIDGAIKIIFTFNEIETFF